MPIKFRCQHCQQLLGISHTKAGGVVDCPSCGRSIRVPQMDGRVDPVPEPSLIKDDSQLAEAFDELANLNEPVKIGSPELDVGKSSRSDSVVLAPTPVAKSVSLPPVPTPKKVTVETPRQMSQSSGERSAEEELLELAKSLPTGESPSDINVTKSRDVKTKLSTLVWSCFILIASLVSFCLGYYLASPSQNNEQNQSEIAQKKRVDADSGSNFLAPTQNWVPAVTGRITYRTETGESRPDRGARVFVFPAERKGTARISAVGLRPGDGEVDFTISKTSLQIAHSNVTRVDDDGKFQLMLPAAGNYQILVVSRFVSQNLEDQTDSKMEKTLGDFFLKPAEVVGKLATVFGPISFNGDEPIQWDHAFEAK